MLIYIVKKGSFEKRNIARVLFIVVYPLVFLKAGDIQFLRQYFVLVSIVINLWTLHLLIKSVSRKVLISLIIRTHLITLLFGLIILLNKDSLDPLFYAFNADSVYSSDRISLLDKEPSYAIYRLVFLAMLFLQIKTIFNSKFIYIIFLALTLILSISVGSKILITFFVGLIVAFVIRVIKFKTTFVQLFTFAASCVIFVFFLGDFIGYVQSSFFGSLSKGSFLSRSTFFLSGWRAFLSNPLGLGVLFHDEVRIHIGTLAYQMPVLNAELSELLSLKEYSTYFTPKSALLQFGLIFGWFPALLILKNLIGLFNSTSLANWKELLNLGFKSFVLFSWLFLDMSIGLILYTILIVKIFSNEGRLYNI